MLTIYFSGTGNTKYIAELFSHKMNTKCLSIEDNANFSEEIKLHDTVAFCYPIYGSRVPRIMRDFVAKYTSELTGKKIVILVTQLLFSGDGARAFTDLFEKDTITVIYAEHFNMPNNICNFALKRTSPKRIQQYVRKAEKKMVKICQDIQRGIVVKRGFSSFSQMLGNFQGKKWQGSNEQKDGNKAKPPIEIRAKCDVKIHEGCTACNICVSICPMKNLENVQNEIKQKNDCTICYRCVNRCSQKAITVWIHDKPKWQYKGLG